LDVVTKEIESAEERGLAMKHDLLRWKTIRNQVRVVIAACDVKQRSLDLAAT
jgi:hypothetical protein